MKIQLRNFLSAQKKSILKAGQGLDIGKYAFFTSSTNQTKYINEYNYEQEALIFGTGGKANIHYCNEPFGTSTDCLVFYKKNNVNLKLLYYFLSANIYLLEAGFKGAGLKHISKEYILNLKIDIPEIEIQNHIVAVLDKINILIEQKKIQLGYLDKIVLSRFTELCGDPISNPFNWKKKKISEVCTKIGSGATPKGGKASYISEGISLIRSMNVHNGYFKYDELAHISENQAKELQNVCIEKNDVLLNITGASVARSCIVPNNILPARVNQHVSILRANLKILEPIFLNLVLINDNYQHYLLSISESNGATRQALTKQQIENLVIPIPPLECQSRMACYFKRINKSKVEIQKSLDKLEMLKKSLMQQYFG